MSSLLYYSISSDLTKILEIDEQVAKNREAVFLFIRKLPSNSKVKAKRLFVYGMFIFQLGQPLVPCATAVMMPLAPAIHRLSHINYEQERILSNKINYSPQIASILKEKVDKILLTDDQIKEFNNLALQLNSGSIMMEEAVLQIRGG